MALTQEVTMEETKVNADITNFMNSINPTNSLYDYEIPVVTQDEEIAMNDEINEYDSYNLDLDPELDIQEQLYYENLKTCDTINQSTIDNLFGKDWNGSFTNMTNIVQKSASTKLSEIAYYANLIEYFSNTKINSVASLSELTRKAGLAEVTNKFNNAMNSFNLLSSSIENFKTIGVKFSQGDLLSNTETILSSLESTFGQVENLANNIEDMANWLENKGLDFDNLGSSLEKMADEVTENVTNFINDKIDQVKDLISGENLSNLLTNFPQSVISSLLGMDVVQNLFTMPARLFNSLTAVMTGIMSIKAPTNFASTLTLIKQLKATVSQMKDVQRQIQDGANQIKNLKNSLKNGNYIGVLLKASGACTFLQKSTGFAAKYPYNQAHRTEGGHLFEIDNTKNAERLHVQHKTGTDCTITPKGDLLSTVKNDCQIVVDSNMETHVKKDQKMVIDKGASVEAKSMNLTTKENMSLSADSCTLNATTLSVLGTTMSINSSTNLTLTSNIGTSVSSNGPLYLTSNSAVIIAAPLVQIAGSTPTGGTGGVDSMSFINVTPGSILATSPTETFTSMDNTFISSPNLITAGATTMITGALITLG